MNEVPPVRIVAITDAEGRTLFDLSAGLCLTTIKDGDGLVAVLRPDKALEVGRALIAAARAHGVVDADDGSADEIDPTATRH